jgi:hypothetical protein
MRYFSLVAEQGNALVQSFPAELFESDKGLTTNYDEDIRLHNLAATQCDEYAIYTAEDLK